jgi:two-component system sensor histidine kinase BaeS
MEVPSAVKVASNRMKIGITAKFFLAILVSCALVAVAMAIGMHYSFSQGFLGYLNEQEAQRVESLRPTLIKAYREHGSWDFLRGNPDRWFALIRPPGMEPAGPGSAEPPVRPASLDSDLTGLNLRVGLFDANGRVVIGAPHLAATARLSAIEVEGATVGWVALVPFQRVSTGAGARFQQQQLKANSFIGVSAVLLAALVAFLLARVFLAPVKRLAASTHRLAAGDYSGRVEVASRDELGRLAEDFNELAVVLENNEVLRKNFMADVSHELRTPLAVLKGEIEALQDGIRPLTQASLQSLQNEIVTLSKLVNDLYELSLSDVGALTYRKSRIDLLALLRQACALFEGRFAEKSISVELHLPPASGASGDGDPDRIRQLFVNLLENSFRYTHTCGRLVISSCLKDGALWIQFEDSAPGVPAALLPHLFERFVRGEQSRNRATGGAGLGLAIARNIVSAHRGTISAHASTMGGLRICATIPVTQDESP